MPLERAADHPTFELGGMDDGTTELATGDSVVVPVGVCHYLEAGSEGCSFLVTMLVDTKMFLDDGTVFVPAWVGSEHRS